MLEKEFQYYLDHQDELVKQFNNKFIVIKDGNVIGHYDNKDDAYFETQKEHDLGSFLIQYCSPGNMAYTQNFYSLNVAF
jgi:hypothetical protein